MCLEFFDYIRRSHELYLRTEAEDPCVELKAHVDIDRERTVVLVHRAEAYVVLPTLFSSVREICIILSMR